MDRANTLVFSFVNQAAALQFNEWFANFLGRLNRGARNPIACAFVRTYVTKDDITKRVEFENPADLQTVMSADLPGQVARFEHACAGTA